MGEIVNLRLVKKRAARVAAAAEAAENRVRHGRTAAAKAADRLERALAAAVVEGARLEDEKGGETE